MNEISAAESMGETIGYIIGCIIVIVIVGAIIGWIGKFIFPKSKPNKRFLWGIVIAVGLSMLSFCGRIAGNL